MADADDPRDPAGPGDHTLLRLASFNIRNGRALDGCNSWWFRRKRVAETIRRLAPDVIGIQEAFGFQARWLRSALPDYDSYGVGRDDGAGRGEQTLVLWRHDRFSASATRTRWFSDRPDVAGSTMPGSRFPRTVTVVALDAADGSHFWFANTHLDAAVPAIRERSAGLLGDWLAKLDGDVVVVGDLNETADQPAVQTLLGTSGPSLTSAVTEGGSNHDFTGRTDGRRIDHILVPTRWELVRGWVDHRLVGDKVASDHWPVVADVERP